MTEGVVNQSENNVENLGEWKGLKEAGPRDAETFLAEKELPHHEASISASEDLNELMRIDDLVSEMENKFIKQSETIAAIDDPSEKAEAQKVYNQSRFVMRHLGYLREVARKRTDQLELRGFAVNDNATPVAVS